MIDMVKTIYFKIDDYDLPIMIINLKDQSIVSIPTQIGCIIDCLFCISKDSQFIRNLTSSEMISLAEASLEEVKNDHVKLSFTGEGEPYLNLKEINKTIDYFSQEKSPFKSFRLCSSGVKPSLFNNITGSIFPIELQFSLHSPFDDKRKEIIPISKDLDVIINSIKLSESKYNQISINYVLMAGVNDHVDDLTQLSSIVDKNWNIKLNPLLDETDFSTSHHHDFFYNYLKERDHNVYLFKKIGSSIKNNIYDTLTYKKGASLISSHS